MFILVPRLVKLWDLLVLGHQGNLELGLTLLPQITMHRCLLEKTHKLRDGKGLATLFAWNTHHATGLITFTTADEQ